MKTIALVSGGLDSILAARLIKECGLDVVGLRFRIPFCHDRGASIPDIGIEIKEVDIGDDFLKMIQSPKYGFGSHINPCIDCKILMLKKAGELMGQYGAKFIATGEVLGQRPMSQHKQALLTIAKQAGLEGLVLRPLCAKLMPETIPEKEGWVRRESLLNFSGRSRKQQVALAESFGIKEYIQPAGGCLLTDRMFSGRLRDLISHEGLSRDNVELLKLGRHFRLNDSTKLVVGRDENENERLAYFARESDYLFMPHENLAGPTSLGRGIFNDELIRLSCSITGRYCDTNGSVSVGIAYKKACEKENNILSVLPMEENKLSGLRI